MFDRLKSLPLTIVLTILIWMYAEAQFTSTQEITIYLKLTPPPSAGNVAVRIEDTDGKARLQVPLQVTLQGTREQLDAIYQESLGTQMGEGMLANLNYELSEQDLNADRFLDAVQLLNRLQYFRKKGVTVTHASPSALRVEVDRLASIQRTIQFESGGPVRAEVSQTIPDIATVQIPQKLMATFGNSGNLRVIATPIRDLAELEKEKEQTIPARLSVEYPGVRDDRVTVTPQQVNITLKIPKEQLAVITISDVPVWVSGPPALLARYDVDVQPKFLKIAIAGTESALRPIRAARDSGQTLEPLMRAYLDVQLGDQPSQDLLQRTVRYVLPEGVELRDGPRSVSFRLVAKNR